MNHDPLEVNNSPETLGNNVVAIYAYIPIIRASNIFKPPTDIDYGIVPSPRLEKKLTFLHGELIKVEYYGNYNEVTDEFEKPVIVEETVYVRDAKKYAKERTTTISWYLNDGSLHSVTKERKKHYRGKAEKIAESKRRRGNIITDLISRSIDSPIEDDIITTFKALADQEEAFILTGSSDLSTAITNSTDAWLDLDIPDFPGVTMRMFVLDELSFGEVP